MSKEKNCAHGGGINFFGMLTIVFIALKLTDHIDWSWWWVLAPLWVPFAAAALVLALMMLAWLVDGKK